MIESFAVALIAFLLIVAAIAFRLAFARTEYR